MPGEAVVPARTCIGILLSMQSALVWGSGGVPGRRTEYAVVTVARHFRYAVDRRYLPVLLPFFLRPSKDGVTLTEKGEFVATFGLFRITTPLANIVGAHVTRHYRGGRPLGFACPGSMTD